MALLTHLPYPLAGRPPDAVLGRSHSVPGPAEALQALAGPVQLLSQVTRGLSFPASLPQAGPWATAPSVSCIP